MDDEWHGNNNPSDEVPGGAMSWRAPDMPWGRLSWSSEQLNFDWGDTAGRSSSSRRASSFFHGPRHSERGRSGVADPRAASSRLSDLLLEFQAATDTYASWAYAWALLRPDRRRDADRSTGCLHRRWTCSTPDLRTAAVGLGLFIGFGLFFENIIGIDEDNRSTVLRNALPVMAIALGALIVILNMIPWRHRGARYASDVWRRTEPPTPPPAG